MMDKADCPYCDGKGHSRAFPQQKCIKCGGKGYRVRSTAGTLFVQEIDQPAIITPTAPQSHELAPMTALSDADLHERTEAAWSLLMAYLAETRRRAGIVLQSDEIPF